MRPCKHSAHQLCTSVHHSVHQLEAPTAPSFSAALLFSFPSPAAPPALQLRGEAVPPFLYSPLQSRRPGNATGCSLQFFLQLSLLFGPQPMFGSINRTYRSPFYQVMLCCLIFLLSTRGYLCGVDAVGVYTHNVVFLFTSDAGSSVSLANYFVAVTRFFHSRDWVVVVQTLHRRLADGSRQYTKRVVGKCSSSAALAVLRWLWILKRRSVRARIYYSHISYHNCGHFCVPWRFCSTCLFQLHVCCCE